MEKPNPSSPQKHLQWTSICSEDQFHQKSMSVSGTNCKPIAIVLIKQLQNTGLLYVV